MLGAMELPAAETVLASIRSALEGTGADWRELEHEATRTSEDSARVRGEPLRVGAKALLVKADERFVLLVLSAARKLDSRKLRAALGVRKTRFASADELLELTGLVPGSVPPFGDPVLPFPLYVDRSVLESERVAFNAGSLTRSVIVAREAWQAAARPTAVLDFTQQP
jgi:prolyl-tRNA editing enzyme YbaK/EbsC (Cys-tRNA(Pro) deacylase)